MSASIHRHSCAQLGVCQHRHPACDNTCAHPKRDAEDVEPMLHAEGCQRTLAVVAILVLVAPLACVLGLHVLWSLWP